MTKGFKVAPERVAWTSGMLLSHEKSVKTTAQYTSSRFSESVRKIGVGLPWVYGVGYQRSECNVVNMSIVSWIKK